VASELQSPPLAGVRVVELSREPSAAYCARQFALWGADVVVVEPDGGSPIRRLPPHATGKDAKPISLVWEYLAANKRAVGADTPAELRELMGGADVLVSDFGPKELQDIGVSLTTLEDDFPNLCVVWIGPFGLSGPYAGYRAAPIVAEALSGYLSLNGLPDRAPLRAPGLLTAYAVGANAFVAALAALLKRERTGFSERVEVSAMETLATMVPFLRVQYFGRDKRREGGTEAGVRLVPCADGWISMTVANPAQKDRLAEIFEIPAEAFPKDLFEGGYAEVVRKTVDFYGAFTSKWRSEDLFYALTVGGLTCGKVMSLRELLEIDQLRERGFFQERTHAELGPLLAPGPPAILKRARPAPLGPAPQAPSAVSDLAWTPRALRRGQPDRRTERPLEGVRVLDLTQAWIGPFATLLFADLGADVIKIESHRRPDVWRLAATQPPGLDLDQVAPPNRSWYFNSVNHNKRNLTLDLRKPEGKALFLRLLEGADIVAENFTASVMDDFGLGYPELQAVKPDIVMMSSSGYGKSGPWSQFKTNGSAIEAVAGWDWLHRYRDGPPVLMGFYQADPIDGLQMAATTLVCLIRRSRTGEGDAIDGAMLDASVGYLGELILQAQLLGEPEPLGNRSAAMSPYGVFPCAGEDRWIAIAADSDEAWRRLASTAGLADPSFENLAGRKAHEDELEERLSNWTRTRCAEELMEALQGLGIPAGVVRSVREALDDPHLAERQWFRRLSRADIGEHRHNGYAWRFAGCALKPSSPPPRLGEHSDEVLKELLGLSAEEISDLKTKDVTGAVL
jgi:crotonobetainyl-CoA:carnitine CoA-transferase CaiB-like acyl-CoA transferase